MQVFLIRHPPPRHIDGLCYGRLEVAVDEHAVAAAAHGVFATLPVSLLAQAQVYYSPLTRCVALARSLAAPLEPMPVEDLIEMNFGAWEGLAWNAVPRDELDAWAQDPWCYRPGGGESAQSVAARWQHWLDSLRQRGASVAVAVTHAGVIRVAHAGAGLMSLPMALSAAIPFGSVHRFDIA
jgi:alpha-ribazole phosphatase